MCNFNARFWFTLPVTSVGLFSPGMSWGSIRKRWPAAGSSIIICQSRRPRGFLFWQGNKDRKLMSERRGLLKDPPCLLIVHPAQRKIILTSVGIYYTCPGVIYLQVFVAVFLCLPVFMQIGCHISLRIPFCLHVMHEQPCTQENTSTSGLQPFYPLQRFLGM